MEYPWIQMFSLLLVLNRTGPTWLRLFQNIVEIFLKNVFIVALYIALKLIEDQRLVECWYIYCSEINRISEDCWILGWILLWNLYDIRSLLNAGLYISLKLIEDQRLVEFWAVYYYAIDIISEAFLILGCIFIWNWYKTRGLFNDGLYIDLKLI